jgi:hypothetical protein
VTILFQDGGKDAKTISGGAFVWRNQANLHSSLLSQTKKNFKEDKKRNASVFSIETVDDGQSA